MASNRLSVARSRSALRQTGRAWRPDLPLIVLAVFVFVDIGRIQLIYPPVARFRPGLLLAGAAILLTLNLRDLSRGARKLEHPLMFTVFLLLFWGMVSIPGALVGWSSFHFWTGDFLKTVVMAVVFLLAIRNQKDAEFLAMAIFGAIALYGLFVLRRFHVGYGERLAALYTYDANDLAQVIVTVLPIGIFLLRYKRFWLTRLMVGASVAALLVLLVESGSRGGFLGFSAALGYMLIYGGTVSLRKRLAMGLFAIVTLVVLGLGTGYWSFIRTMANPSEDYNTTSETGRVAIWKRGVGYMVSHPIVGVGINGFTSAEGRLSGMPQVLEPGQGWKWSAAHNSFIQVGAELGIPGLLLYCWLWLRLFKTARRMSRDRALPLEVRHLSTALTVSLVGFVTTAFFLSQAYASTFYVLVAIVAGLDISTRVHGARSADSRSRRFPDRNRGGIPYQQVRSLRGTG